MLPPFVIPECNITLENVWRYITLYPEGPINYDKAAVILGTYDTRTISKHIDLGFKIIKEADLKLSEFLSTFTGYAEVPVMEAGESEYIYLNLLVKEIEKAQERMGLTGYEPVSPVVYVHILYVYKKCRIKLKTSLNRVFHTLLFFDTS